MVEADLQTWDIAYADDNAVHALINSEFLIRLNHSTVEQFLSAVNDRTGSVLTTADVLVPRTSWTETPEWVYYPEDDNDEPEEEIYWNYNTGDDLSQFVLRKDVQFTLNIAPEDAGMFEHTLYASGLLEYVLY